MLRWMEVFTWRLLTIASSLESNQNIVIGHRLQSKEAEGNTLRSLRAEEFRS